MKNQPNESIKYLREGDPWQKITAAALLAFASSTDPTIDDALLEAARSDDREVRRAAMEALVRRNPARDPKPLLRAIRRSHEEFENEEPTASEILEYRLARLKSVDVPSILLSAAENGEVDFRPDVAAALGETRDPRALDALRRAITDVDASVRASAVRGLMRFREEAVGDLVRVLKSDDDASARSAAAAALGTVGTPEAGEALAAHARDPDRGVRQAVAAARRELSRSRPR